jgi:multiple sugar transport system permease protein
MFLRVFPCLAALAGCGLALAGPGSQLPSPEPLNRTTITVWGIGLGPDSKGTEAKIREFERRNPGIKVRVLSMGAGGMSPQKLMTSIVGNVPPDVIHQDRFTISDWASRGAFMPLDDLITRDRDAKDPLVPKQEQYYPAPWQEAMWEGKVYAIPTSADNRVLYWNRARFQEKAADLRAAGLDPDRAPRTWNELLAYNKVLTEFGPNGELKKVGFLPNFGNAWLYIYAFQNNGQFMTPDGRNCTLAEGPNVEALQFMMEGYKQVGGYEKAVAFQSGFQGNENDPFILGQVAMKIDGDWILSGLSRYAPQLDFATAPPPVPDDRFFKRGRFAEEKDTFVTWMGGFSYAIPRGAKNVDAAWKFIKFVTSTEGWLIEGRAQREWERRRGRVYVVRMLGNREANEAQFKELAPADPRFRNALRSHIDIAPYGRIRPATFVSQLLWDEHVRAIDTALFGKAPAKDALLTGQMVVQRELDTFYGQSRFPVLDLSMPIRIGIGLIIVAVVACVVWFSRLRLGRLERHEALWAYAFILPWLIGFLIFTLGPMLASLFLSFTKWDVLNAARWVGPKNYVDLVTTDQVNVTRSFQNVAYLAGIGVPLSLFTGLAVALLLNAAVRGMRYYRTLFYMPAIVPGVASAVLWIWLLTPDPGKGLINSGWNSTLTQWLAIAPPGWLNAEAWAKNSLILMGMWGAGSGMILWLAGLKGVPTTLYEAANIDGASPSQSFWNITMPQLSSIIFFNTVMGFIGALQEFDRVFIMRPAQGPVGPGDSLLVPVFHLFTNGFNYFKMGYASALAWVIFAIILALTAIQFKLAPRWVHYESQK